MCRGLFVSTLCLTLLAVACDRKKSSDAPAKLEVTALAERGKSVYQMNCTACHSSRPTIDGSLGPAIAGSSLDLLRARVVDGKYPEGYAPKRSTKVMVPMPHVSKEIEALHAYLNQREEK